MIEGWHQKNYLILAENQDEESQLTEEYSLSQYLPGHTIVGLMGWDDFIVKNSINQLHTIPTIPIKESLLKPLNTPIDLFSLVPDERLKNKIKWYIKPLIFGGDPKLGENVKWISMHDHVLAVKYWNDLYEHIRKSQGT